MSAATQTRLPLSGWALPLDPTQFAAESIFEIRHQLRCLDLSDEQIAAAEAAVALVRQGAYPTTNAAARQRGRGGKWTHTPARRSGLPSDSPAPAGADAGPENGSAA